MPLTIINGPVIAAGEVLSEPIDCRAGQMVRVTAPAAWTPACITFQISTDGQFFNDYVDRFGVEYMANVIPGTAIGFLSDWSRPVAFVKFRSGKRDHPIIQEARREFAVTLEIT